MAVLQRAEVDGDIGVNLLNDDDIGLVGEQHAGDRAHRVETDPSRHPADDTGRLGWHRGVIDGHAAVVALGEQRSPDPPHRLAALRIGIAIVVGDGREDGDFVAAGAQVKGKVAHDFRGRDAVGGKDEAEDQDFRHAGRQRRRPCCHSCSAASRGRNPVRIRTTVSATSGAVYSGGGTQPVDWLATSRTWRSTSSGSVPESTLDPQSIVSGRSVTSRSVTFGTPNKHASSCTVPLSDRMQKAERSRLMKSRNPSGSRKRRPSRAISTPNASTFARVRGWNEQITGSPNSWWRRASDSTRSRSLSARSTFSARCIVTRK